jgi:hypothetical protein
MVISKSTASPALSPYRVDTARGDQGDITYQVVHCSPVASFDNLEHASFLVDLLVSGGAHHG